MAKVACVLVSVVATAKLELAAVCGSAITVCCAAKLMSRGIGAWCYVCDLHQECGLVWDGLVDWHSYIWPWHLLMHAMILPHVV